jgi:polysaccharide pyruvyl transferase WcaK-like protein
LNEPETEIDYENTVSTTLAGWAASPDGRADRKFRQDTEGIWDNTDRQKRLCVKTITIRSDESASKRIDKKKNGKGLDYDERVKQGNREDKSEV